MQISSVHSKMSPQSLRVPTRFKVQRSRAGKLAPCVKAFAAESDNLSLVPRAHIAEGLNLSLRIIKLTRVFL